MTKQQYESDLAVYEELIQQVVRIISRDKPHVYLSAATKSEPYKRMCGFFASMYLKLDRLNEPIDLKGEGLSSLDCVIYNTHFSPQTFKSAVNDIYTHWLKILMAKKRNIEIILVRIKEKEQSASKPKEQQSLLNNRKTTPTANTEKEAEGDLHTKEDNTDKTKGEEKGNSTDRADEDTKESNANKAIGESKESREDEKKENCTCRTSTQSKGESLSERAGAFAANTKNIFSDFNMQLCKEFQDTLVDQASKAKSKSTTPTVNCNNSNNSDNDNTEKDYTVEELNYVDALDLSSVKIPYPSSQWSIYNKSDLCRIITTNANKIIDILLKGKLEYNTLEYDSILLCITNVYEVLKDFSFPGTSYPQSSKMYLKYIRNAICHGSLDKPESLVEVTMAIGTILNLVRYLNEAYRTKD